MNKEKLIKAIEVYQSENFHEKLDDLENLDSLFYELEENFNPIFTIELRTSREGSDSWLQCEYYSEKLQKTIIYFYNVRDYFENAEDLADYYIKTEEEINDFEKRITINK